MLTAKDLNIKILEENKGYGKFSLSPLPGGYGYTLGNMLRRVMLSSMKGAAFTEAVFKGVPHQFTTIEGVKEDVLEILLNLKEVRIKKHTNEPSKLKLKAEGKKVVTAGDIEESSDVEIVNKDQVIATLTSGKSKIETDLTAETGAGFSPSEERKTQTVGAILLDSVFNPVRKVAYVVEPTRVGGEGDLDNLTMELTTDGTITAHEALMESAGILRQFFAKINAGADEDLLTDTNDDSEVLAGQQKSRSTQIDEVNLPTRTINALKKAGINTVEDLFNREMDELSAVKGLGEKSVSDIKKALKDLKSKQDETQT